MASIAAWFGVVSYGIAALAYAAATVMLLVSHPGSRLATWLTTAVAVSSVWAGLFAALLLVGSVPLAVVVDLDALHALVWIACVSSWLGSAALPRSSWPSRRGYVAIACLLCLWVIAAPPALPNSAAVSNSVFPALLAMALVGLLVIEQVFRNAQDDQRRSLVLPSLAVGGVFVIDVVAYAQATLLGGVVPFLWQSRGIASAALVPLLLLAVKRQSEWERALFVSRQVTFYTASLIGVGSYLLTMGGIAYVIRSAGGEWGPLLQVVFLLLAAVVLLAVLFSASIRARFRVFLVKHFYRHKYDYREEWLRLTASLGRSSDLRQLTSSALAGIARIVGSQRGSLWLGRDGQRYERLESLGGEPIGAAVYALESPIVKFLGAKGWVIDSDEYRRETDRYGTAFGAPEDGVLPAESITVPLDCQGTLQGFVILLRPPHTQSLNFEDHDILKTAGRQVAVVLAQAMAQEQLAETRQFEAVSKLTTFLMHDLKNLVAQQDLLVANAQRFRHRPEFIDDAIATVKSGVERMKKVLEQLRQAGDKETQWSRVDLSKVLMEVRSQCADRAPVPAIDLPNEALWVTMDKERLASVFTHLIRNAQDATPAEGSVTIDVSSDGRSISVAVVDTGRGMAQEFIRDRLFRPFDSTKGAQGMGIGAYQVRDVVRAAGGDVDVRSEVGVGTAFRVRLPLAAGRGQ